MSLLRICQQSEEQNAQMIEMEPNPLNIEVKTQRDGIGTDRESNVQINSTIQKCDTINWSRVSQYLV